MKLFYVAGVPQSVVALKRCIEESHEPNIKLHNEKVISLQIIFQVFYWL